MSKSKLMNDHMVMYCGRSCAPAYATKLGLQFLVYLYILWAKENIKNAAKNIFNAKAEKLTVTTTLKEAGGDDRVTDFLQAVLEGISHLCAKRGEKEKRLIKGYDVDEDTKTVTVVISKDGVRVAQEIVKKYVSFDEYGAEFIEKNIHRQRGKSRGSTQRAEGRGGNSRR